jgi:DNA-binding GntR family transcriptional regulator
MHRTPSRPKESPPAGERQGWDIPRLQRRTATDLVYEALHRSIVEMELKPGELIQEKQLTARFAVSRTPVREALIHLVRDGLVDIVPQSGTTVSRIPIGAIGEAMVIRRALETVTVTRAAETATEADIAGLDAILAQQRLADKIDDIQAFHNNDEGFHEFIAGIGNFSTIWKLVRQTKVQIDRVRRLTLPVKGRMAQVIKEHVRIRDAIAAGDPEAAIAALNIHLNIIVPDVDELSVTYPDYFVGHGLSAAPAKAKKVRLKA